MPLKMLRQIYITLSCDQFVDALLSVRTVFEMRRGDFANLEILEFRGLDTGEYSSGEYVPVARSQIGEHMPDELKHKCRICS